MCVYKNKQNNYQFIIKYKYTPEEVTGKFGKVSGLEKFLFFVSVENPIAFPNKV